jgi:hypothetical protein
MNSKPNSTSFKKGCTPWNKGKKIGIVPPNAFKKGHHASACTEFKKGELTENNNNNWKGDKVGYSALHHWVTRKKGKATVCSACSSCKNVQWANISGEYKRDVNDYKALCYKHHREYDKSKGWGNISKRFPTYIPYR